MVDKTQTTPIYRNGYVKIILSFAIMGFAFTLQSPMNTIQFVAGVAYFCLGLKYILDARKHDRI